MINRILSIINISIFFIIFLLPFYTGTGFKIFLAYILSFIWFMLILLIGFSMGFSYFLLIFYLVGSIIYQVNFLNFDVLIGSFVGICAAYILYYSRGMNLER